MLYLPFQKVMPKNMPSIFFASQPKFVNLVLKLYFNIKVLKFKIY